MRGRVLVEEGVLGEALEEAVEAQAGGGELGVGAGLPGGEGVAARGMEHFTGNAHGCSTR
jgi:hypothetical protein